MPVRQYKTATIAISTTTSGEVRLDGLKIGAILFPSAFDGATVTFELPDNAGGWSALGGGVSITVATDTFVPVTEGQSHAIGDNFRIVSASTETAARTLIIAPR